MKIIKKDQENKQEINIETYLKKKIKKENGKNRYLNMSEEKKKTKRISKKLLSSKKKSKYNNK